jgi:hypothetical protein
MDTGCYINCNKLTTQSASTKNKCSVPTSVKETFEGCRFKSEFNCLDFVLTKFEKGSQNFPAEAQGFERNCHHSAYELLSVAHICWMGSQVAALVQIDR